MSRWENAPGLRVIIRLMEVMIDLYLLRYAPPGHVDARLSQPIL
jgi:hypothetical protein